MKFKWQQLEILKNITGSVLRQIGKTAIKNVYFVLLKDFLGKLTRAFFIFFRIIRIPQSFPLKRLRSTSHFLLCTFVTIFVWFLIFLFSNWCCDTPIILFVHNFLFTLVAVIRQYFWMLFGNFLRRYRMGPYNSSFLLVFSIV